MQWAVFIVALVLITGGGVLATVPRHGPTTEQWMRHPLSVSRIQAADGWRWMQRGTILQIIGCLLMQYALGAWYYHLLWGAIALFDLNTLRIQTNHRKEWYAKAAESEREEQAYRDQLKALGDRFGFTDPN